ncbi:hypothetical protein T310_2348 [Rasamsonia emersonii CBS 393.64]|uniref:Uncharacterized protein n=1 Tax=Rasamsonia emersonii (strain ATCC 16479 / CBS 393.64 / IMI 116815) TaxID=1408163 RepID=A0A0F4Z0P0_RASE3|nr:hypothetical protein T310_2348 [Rasamsonia emersonii CBS 393.64]KKA23631.1 hypothetical protein T310_2348 [Rasamsonia emersonii CBS 393.64]
MAPGVDAVNSPAKASGKKVKKKKQHRSQSFHQRPQPDNAQSPSVTAADPCNGNSPPALSETVAASQEKPKSKETSFFEQAFFPEELDRERSYDDNGEIIERDTLAAYGFCDWHAINVADPGPYYIVIDKPVNNHDVHDDDIMFDITQYLDMDKPDTTLTLEPPKEDVTMADEPQAEMSNLNADNVNNANKVNNDNNAKSPSPSKAKKNKNWKRKAAKEKEKEKETGGGYLAPNGTYMSPEELKAYAKGVKNENGDTVVFFPEFIEDPWKGLKPVPTECERRYKTDRRGSSFTASAKVNKEICK